VATEFPRLKRGPSSRGVRGLGEDGHSALDSRAEFSVLQERIAIRGRGPDPADRRRVTSISNFTDVTSMPERAFSDFRRVDTAFRMLERVTPACEASQRSQPFR
jgi:hypothetical protein